ncbi:30S ribosomal protein S1 [Halalkalibacterium halodurans]|jgi:small subunit ribosomal protein S1|uniref:30S ribosomal protein S1 n=2 Tax=Halalkalibacterium halodurans TaxID=86665 RepID=Q9KCD6_HALH5|nr:30S ribosomal protein S1 [Halalkalibacterium halodurans]MDY7222208.1 30S ribosomal protein S1 [Halalkalibacterium halodurans]MDY7241429.1 30S ribosomal protein S1 [Halalkalibacterium halodurans]MED4081791.1 30S ribosomal protein S1 [Halalkalibacterium halodurans]MED4086472.1 30S ribosomal protein S1 [Halalkalibacterium halodurans]MED4104992.1 30S ribosomal protein S1 [Halalkalibacterium halodurans]
MVEEMNNEVTEMKSFSVGDVVSGKVTKVEDKQAFVDVGFKVDGIIPISELSSLHVEKVSDVLSEGDELELKVLKVEDDELILSKRAVQAEKAWETLQAALDSGEVIEAEVADVVKGGLVVDLGVRGFIPASLVERHYVEDFSDYKGRTLRLKVVELDKEANKLILSQRAVLDEEVEAKKKEVLASLQPGDVVEGTVQRLTDFGAFVDVGGVDGLVHISQLAHHRVETPAEVVKEGDAVKVKVLSVDPDSERVSLSIKETLPGPWEQVEGTIQPGDVIEGTVKRLVSFGAFVEVAPGVEGLVHISQIANRHIGTPGEVLSEGERVQAKVLDVNISEKRISLSIRELLDDAGSNQSDREVYESTNEESSGFSLGDMIGDELKKYK